MITEEQKIKIAKNLPYPIAFPCKICFAIDAKEEPWKKLDSVLYSTENIVRFLGIIAIAEVARLAELNKTDSGEKNIINDFKKRLNTPAFGTWVEISRELFKYLSKYQDELVLPEVISFYDNKQTKKSVDELVNMRNKLGHDIDKSKLPKDAFIKLAEIAFGFFENIINNIDNFCNISFGYISTIELEKDKREDPKYIYKGKKLDGNDFVEEATIRLAESSYSHFKETKSVIIKFEEKNKYLNLFPFYIYDEINGKSTDIFFYNGRKGNKIKYIACGYGGEFSFSTSQNKQNKAKQDDWMSIISGGTQGEDSVSENVEIVDKINREIDLTADIFSNGEHNE